MPAEDSLHDSLEGSLLDDSNEPETSEKPEASEKEEQQAEIAIGEPEESTAENSVEKSETKTKKSTKKKTRLNQVYRHRNYNRPFYLWR